MVERPGDLARLPDGTACGMPLFGDDAEVCGYLEPGDVALVLASLDDGQVVLLTVHGACGYSWARDVVEA